MATLGTPDRGTCTGFPDYWFAPGAQLHLQVPVVTGEGEVCLKLIPRVTPINAGNLRCKRAHMGLQEGQVG